MAPTETYAELSTKAAFWKEKALAYEKVIDAQRLTIDEQKATIVQLQLALAKKLEQPLVLEQEQALRHVPKDDCFRQMCKAMEYIAGVLHRSFLKTPEGFRVVFEFAEKSQAYHCNDMIRSEAPVDLQDTAGRIRTVFGIPVCFRWRDKVIPAKRVEGGEV